MQEIPFFLNFRHFRHLSHLTCGSMKNKGKAEEVLTKLFGSTLRATILTLLFENIGRSFYQREIMYETGLALQTVQRELSPSIHKFGNVFICSGLSAE